MPLCRVFGWRLSDVAELTMPQFLRLQDELGHMAREESGRPSRAPASTHRIDLTTGTAEQAAATLRRYGFG